MMKQIRFFLYAVLAIIAVLLWSKWQQEHPDAFTSTSSTTTASTPSGAVNASAAVPVATGLSNNNTVPSAQNSAVNSSQFISVKTDTLNVMINPVGGNIVSADLIQYPLSLKDKTQPVRLLDYQPDNFYVTESGLTDLPGTNNKPAVFTAEKTSYQLAPNQNQLIVNLTWRDPKGVQVTKSYTFNRNSYAINVNYTINNKSAQPWQGRFYMQTKRADFQPATDTNLHFVKTFYGLAISSPDDPYQKFTYDKLAKQQVSQNIKGGWLAFVQHYFLSAWVPDAKSNFYYYSQLNNNVLTAGMMSDQQQVQPGQTVQLGSKLYVGPEIASNLDQLAPHLSLTIDYGWLWFISVIIFWLMKHIYNFVGNWGWSIILVTLLIKLAFYKLSETSYRSMAKMRALQPKLQLLKERHADDKQAFSKAMMELYRKEKINPMGGCLPMIIQLPVFIALYWVLIESVDLRMAPFILWIHDLSAADPYFILPIIMGLTMLLQQMMNPQQMFADPMQQKMMYLLPVVFTVLFLNFPSGLVLYWIVNSVLSILQQWFIMKRFDEGAYKKHDKK